MFEVSKREHTVGSLGLSHLECLYAIYASYTSCDQQIQLGFSVDEDPSISLFLVFPSTYFRFCSKCPLSGRGCWILFFRLNGFKCWILTDWPTEALVLTFNANLHWSPFYSSSSRFFIILSCSLCVLVYPLNQASTRSTPRVSHYDLYKAFYVYSATTTMYF